jgi:hypothetical protein
VKNLESSLSRLLGNLCNLQEAFKDFSEFLKVIQHTNSTPETSSQEVSNQIFTTTSSPLPPTDLQQISVVNADLSGNHPATKPAHKSTHVTPMRENNKN